MVRRHHRRTTKACCFSVAQGQSSGTEWNEPLARRRRLVSDLAPSSVLRLLVGNSLGVLALLCFNVEAFEVVVALDEVLANAFDKQETKLHIAFTACGKPDFAVDLGLVETEVGALLHIRH